MFGKIAAFELRYQLRSPVFWVVAVLFGLMVFGSMASDQIQVGGGGGNIHKNAAYTIVQNHLIWSLFYMFVTTAFVANVIVRDDDTGYAPLIRSTRITKADYLYGRFAGAFAAAAISFLIVPLAMMLGAAMPWLDAEKVGAFNLAHYAFAYGVMALPLLLLTSSLFFLVATVTRSTMLTYVTVVAVLVAYFVFNIAVSKPELETLAAWSDPLGMGAFEHATKYWTAVEKNELLPPLTGPLLANRIGVLAASALFLGLAWATFRLDTAAQSGRKRRKTQAAEPVEAAPSALADPHAAKPRFDTPAVLAQLWARTRLDVKLVFLSPAYFVLLGLGLANGLGNLWFTVSESIYGGAMHPVTRALLMPLMGGFGIIPIIIAIFYSGELVWRERDRKTHEIIDAAPAPDAVFVAPKVLAISLVLLSTILVSVLAGMLVQVAHGYFNFEFGKYLLWYVAPQAADAVLIAVLAVFLQTISPHKFIGWGLMVVYMVATITLSSLGFEHNLYLYDGAPRVPLSDLNGLGVFWIGAWWFRLYWAFCAVALAVASHLLWRRGTETRLAPRLRRAPRRLMTRGAGGLMAVGVVGFIATGVFIYINTNVWNDYRSHIDDEKWQADYEKTLLPFENTPQPKIIASRLDVDIEPKAPSVETHGLFVIENRTRGPLREVHVRFDRDLEVKALSVQGAWAKQSFQRFNYRIFMFDAPMQPGERRTIAFTTVRAQHGFKNSGGDTRVVGNGTFINDGEITPRLGMDRNGLLEDRAKRRKYGLPSELRPAKLGDPKALAFNPLRRDSDFVNADITVTTDADQTPIAPGQKVSDVTADGRRTARFVAEAPIMHFFSIQSARYAEKKETYKGVDLTVFYHPAHAWNVDRMIAVMKLSLDDFQAWFGPYQFKQVRFLEFPAYANFAQSFANTIPWSESLGFISDIKDEQTDKIDIVTYVGAHEVAHQWWGHQLVPADEQGATLLVETLAQYSALRVMKHKYGEPMIRKFLKFELDRYLRSRGGEVLEELPLIRVENQPYIHYQKGSLVMYRLADEIGEAAVDRALRKMLAAHGLKSEPYATSLELVAALRAEAPADKQALITDLFEKITLYDLKAKTPKVTKRADGRYDVAFTVEATKLYADGKGKETAAPMAETLDIGAFTAEPGKKGFDASDVLSVQRVAIRSGAQTVRLVTNAPPKFVGVDPYNILIDRNGDDNLVKAD